MEDVLFLLYQNWLTNFRHSNYIEYTHDYIWNTAGIIIKSVGLIYENSWVTTIYIQ